MTSFTSFCPQFRMLNTVHGTLTCTHDNKIKHPKHRHAWFFHIHKIYTRKFSSSCGDVHCAHTSMTLYLFHFVMHNHSFIVFFLWIRMNSKGHTAGHLLKQTKNGKKKRKKESPHLDHCISQAVELHQQLCTAIPRLVRFSSDVECVIDS